MHPQTQGARQAVRLHGDPVIGWEVDEQAVHGRTRTAHHMGHRIRIYHYLGDDTGFDWEVRRGQHVVWTAGGHERTLKAAKAVAVAVVEART